MRTFTFRVEVQDRNGDGDWEVWEFEREGENFDDTLSSLRSELAGRTDLNDFEVLSATDEDDNYLKVWS